MSSNKKPNLRQIDRASLTAVNGGMGYVDVLTIAIPSIIVTVGAVKVFWPRKS